MNLEIRRKSAYLRSPEARFTKMAQPPEGGSSLGLHADQSFILRQLRTCRSAVTEVYGIQASTQCPCGVKEQVLSGSRIRHSLISK